MNITETGIVNMLTLRSMTNNDETIAWDLIRGLKKSLNGFEDIMHTDFFTTSSQTHNSLNHRSVQMPGIISFTIEGLREKNEYIDIFLFSAHHSIVFCFWCSVYWWKGSVRF